MRFPSISSGQLRVFNLWATIFWIMLILPSVLWWRNSILWVVLMSVWANVSGHFSAWMGARAEGAAEDAADST